MKHFFFILTLGLTAYSSASLEAKDAEIKLINGNSLTGKIISISPPLLTIKSKTKEQAQVLDLKKIASLSYSNNAKPTKSTPQSHLTMLGRIHKTLPRDLYKGSVLSIDNDHVVIDTPYAGKITLNKPFIQNIKFANNGTSSPDDIGKLRDWKKKNNTSRITQEAEGIKFNPPPKHPKLGSQPLEIYRKLKFNDKYKLSFTLHSLEKKALFMYPPQIHITCHASNEGKIIQDSLLLAISHSTLLVHSKDRHRGSLAQARLPSDIRNQKKLDISIYVDVIKGSLVFIVNKQIILDVINLKIPSAQDASSFLNINCLSPIALSDMKFAPWNGIPPIIHNQIPLTKHDGDAIHLSNDDTIFGTIDNINREPVKIQTQHGDYKMHLDKISSLDFIKEEENKILIEQNDARLSFSDGSKFIINIEKFKDQKIWGSSSSFDGIRGFDINKIQLVEFTNSIYQ